MAVTHTDLVSPSMDLAALCINVSRVEIDYDLLAQELKNTYDSNKDRQGLFASGDRGPTNFKAGFQDGVLVLGGQMQTSLNLQVGLIVIDDFTASYCIRAYITGSEAGPVDATIHADSVIKWRCGRLWDFRTLVGDPSFEANVLDVVNDFGRKLASRLTS